MDDTSVKHSTFTIERDYATLPMRVFAAWADPAAKRRWYVESDGADWEILSYELDFRVGGREHGRFRHDGQVVHGNETVYLDIVEGKRIIFAYSMSLDDKRISASVSTVEFLHSGDGTRLIFTEQAAFLDGLDKPDARKGGWDWLLDQLDAELRRTAE
jgi:uncharacterized protein YndB with AHSA1/START domain